MVDLVRDVYRFDLAVDGQFDAGPGIAGHLCVAHLGHGPADEVVMPPVVSKLG